MGFRDDWRAHGRFMRAEFRSAGRACSARPCYQLRRAFTSPLMFALFAIIVTCYFNSVLSIVSERGGNRLDPPLHDQGFSLGDFDAFHLPDYLLYGMLGATALRFAPFWPCTRPAVTAMIFRRWMLIEAVIFFFRGFSVAMTTVPQPNPDCVSTATGSVWYEGLLLIFGQTTTCGDCMFSGHTAAITLLALIWTHYSRGEEFAICCGRRPWITASTDATGDPMGWKLVDLFVWAYALMCYYFIITTRFHYSSDVWIGFTLTYFFFRYYHFYIKSLSLRRGSFVARFMRWFEGIDLAQDLQAKELDMQNLMLDMEAGTGAGPVAAAYPKDAHTPAMHGQSAGAGSAVGASAAQLAATGPATATLLPVSYLEGHRYYRAGDDHNADLAAPLDKDAAAHRDLAYGHSAAGHKHDDGDAPVRINDPYQQEVAAGATHESNTSLGPGPAAATVPVGSGGGFPVAHHSQLPPTAGGVLLTREAAQQEHRELAREHGVQLTHT